MDVLDDLCEVRAAVVPSPQPDPSGLPVLVRHRRGVVIVVGLLVVLWATALWAWTVHP